MNKPISEIKFEEIPGTEGNIGLITLNRPQVLNALNHEMFLALDEKINEWDKSQHIKAIVIQAVAGRAFCAGGDIRYAYERRLAEDPTLPHFFRDEYRMNLAIQHLSKPYIALLNGITMGGGVGISIHGSHRIATENLIFSMPETGIGFYPDVGATYQLARFPCKTGFYLALTGARINYADCFAIGITQEIVIPNDLEKIISVLVETPIVDNNSVTCALKPFNIAVPESELLTHKTEIENCFSKNTVEEIITALENCPSEWCAHVVETIKTKSPTSLKVTLRALQLASQLSFDECMKMEYRLTSRFMQGSDFFEGVRAVLIDKDQKPKWQPASLEAVKNDDIEKYFAPLAQELV